MKLTKQLEEEIMQAYEAYWAGYLNGDMDAFAFFLDEDVTVIGSTQAEVFFNKEQVLHFYRTTADQVTGKAELRNRIIKAVPTGNLILITEQSDFYVLMDKTWTFYAKGRLSTFFQKKKEGWKIIQQHGSMPDIRAAEGEQFAIEKISKENIELRNAVKRRTIELEQKNRELEIEAALERVRTVAMAMQQPDDLLDICSVLYKELQLLGFSELRNAMINIHDDGKGSFLNYDFSGYAGKTITAIPYNSHPVVESHVKQIKSSKDAFAEMVVTGKELADWRKFRKENGEKDDPKLGNINTLYYYFYSVVKGDIGISNFEPVAGNQLAILKRFSNVFDLAYRRYTDISKAADQAREAQIELALERVRARTMAMQQSGELADAAALLFQQIKDLGLDMWSCGFCIWAKDNIAEAWMSADSGGLLPPLMIPYKDEPTHSKIYEAFLRGDIVHEKVWEGEALKKHYEFLQTIPSAKEAIDILHTSGLLLPSRQCYYAGFYRQGYLLLITREPVINAGDLIKRFALVFEQTYTRFLDLQKAEAQAREAKVETALEKVRSRTMAMHKSEEFVEVINVVSEQLQLLHINIHIAGFSLDYKAHPFNIWMAAPGQPYPSNIDVPYREIPMMQRIKQAIDNRLDFYADNFSFEEKNQWLDNVLENTIIRHAPEERKTFMLNAPGLAVSIAMQQHIALMMGNYAAIPYSDEENGILKRFAQVFEQTYTRFLDLQKAETQAREAQIELSLERVRAKTMAMHNSQDVADTVAIMFDEVSKLGVATFRCGIGIMHESVILEIWTAKPGDYGKAELIIGRLDMTMHPLLQGSANAWKNKQEFYFYELKGADLIDYYNVINNQAGYPIKYDTANLPPRVMHSEFHFPEGALFVFSLNDLTVDEIKIFKRFSGVFGQTYRRYLDLQKAEASATEAKIEASLERVRSKAMSMHSSQDLADTIGVFYHELELFSITPRRCGVGLIDRETHVTELSTMNTTEEGKSIEIIGKIKLVGHPVLENIYNNWLVNEEYHPVLKGNEIKNYYQLLRPQIAFPDYPHDAVQYGYFFYFPEGGVYAWTDKQMVEDELKIYRRFTSVLSLTYKRYKDLKIAEAHAHQSELDLIQLKAEKKRTELALTELKETQKQLIQSEKMASLGELTAGIAHEIQNPLNFVNNFSEVNRELMEELKIEKSKVQNERDEQLEDELMNDIDQNLEKIAHHGKRADAIVKGMLQHSRSSSAVKEPTDINKLADEYLRLAYHGLRAKDKSFNASLKTDYDETISPVNLIPQDIGRVVLNLITNAFYATGERKKAEGPGYEPTVTITTGSTSSPLGGRRVQIKVSDNGGGIPPAIVDKIFQPFFTTKPTGQGTGLGLSLAYDIVKAQGGEIKVDTKENEGTIFIIELPVG